MLYSLVFALLSSGWQWSIFVIYQMSLSLQERIYANPCIIFRGRKKTAARWKHNRYRYFTPKKLMYCSNFLPILGLNKVAPINQSNRNTIKRVSIYTPDLSEQEERNYKSNRRNVYQSTKHRPHAMQYRRAFYSHPVTIRIGKTTLVDSWTEINLGFLL